VFAVQLPISSQEPTFSKEPAACVATTVGRPASTLPAPTPTEEPARMSVLVADDADNWCDLLARLLRARGHHVYTAASYQEAMSILEGRTIDLAILDVRLIDQDNSNQDGVRLAKQVTAMNPAASSILLTSFDLPDEVERLKREGVVQEVITKGQPKADFDTALAAALARTEAALPNPADSSLARK